MRCLNCGRESEGLLCPACQTVESLAGVFDALIYFNPEKCENPHIIDYAATLPEGISLRDVIPQLLALFPVKVVEYFACLYAKVIRNPQFEEMALAYLSAHDLAEENSQRILQKLLEHYLRNDFIKPRKWCDLVRERNLAGAELITLVIQNYSMTGEYALAEEMIQTAQDACRKGEAHFLYGIEDQERMDGRMKQLEKLKDDNERYRTVKPYWPSTEERRRAVALLYDEKGISYPRIESRPQKVAEYDFKPLVEYDGTPPDSYCAFWCAAGFSVVAAKCIYEIAAVKVRSGNIQGCFQSYVRVWDGIAARKAAAKDGGISLEALEGADDVDIVMKHFFEFVGNDVLVSTDALGEQGKLISRAARYAGMEKIKNPFLDLLDLAEDTLSDLDLAKVSREYLLKQFNIPERTNALSKAHANQHLYQKLLTMGG